MAGKKNVLSSLAVYAEDSEPESDGEAGVEAVGSAAGESRAGSWVLVRDAAARLSGAGGPQVGDPGDPRSVAGIPGESEHRRLGNKETPLLCFIF